MRAENELKKLIRESGRTLKDISEAAGVAPSPLQKWMKGTQRHYNLFSAELVYYELTGELFIGGGEEK